jgi:L-ascorbate metabolism protein UlaG (beta-lactamase superfamily)
MKVIPGLLSAGAVFAQAYQEDLFNAGDGTPVKITFFGHSSLMIAHGGTVFHIDPVETYANYSKLPKADVVLVTHDHSDHFSPIAISAVSKADTDVILTVKCARRFPDDAARKIVLKNGEARIVKATRVEAVPAYNLVHMRSAGLPFHPKGEGNGYILYLGKLRVYVAGDTENTPEMRALEGIDIAFLPMNLPFTMTPEMAADAALAFRPKVLYPYHCGGTDTSRLQALLAGARDIDLRLRKMQ